MKKMKLWLLSGAVVATVAVVALLGGFAIAQAAGQSPSSGRTPADQVTSATDAPRPMSEEEITQWQAKQRAGETPISDCPRVEEFLAQPNVKNFYEKNFGYHFETFRFPDGCPDLAVVKKGYDDARAKIDEGAKN